MTPNYLEHTEMYKLTRVPSIMLQRKDFIHQLLPKHALSILLSKVSQKQLRVWFLFFTTEVGPRPLVGDQA